MGPIVTLPDQVWVLGDQTVGPQGKTPINIFLVIAKSLPIIGFMFKVNPLLTVNNECRNLLIFIGITKYLSKIIFQVSMQPWF